MAGRPIRIGTWAWSCSGPSQTPGRPVLSAPARALPTGLLAGCPFVSFHVCGVSASAPQIVRMRGARGTPHTTAQFACLSGRQDTHAMETFAASLPAGDVVVYFPCMR